MISLGSLAQYNCCWLSEYISGSNPINFDMPSWKIASNMVKLILFETNMVKVK